MADFKIGDWELSISVREYEADDGLYYEGHHLKVAVYTAFYHSYIEATKNGTPFFIKIVLTPEPGVDILKYSGFGEQSIQEIRKRLEESVLPMLWSFEDEEKIFAQIVEVFERFASASAEAGL